MRRLVLVTDSTADIPAAIAEEFGIVVARARYGFAEHAFTDGDQAPTGFYGRMDGEERGPSPFGTPETSFRAAFKSVLDAGNEPVCVVAPFDVNPSFTTALAAMLSLDDIEMKVVNPGVSSAGLCSLLVSLALGLERGWSREELLGAIDRLGPQCDTLFVPGSVDWLERSGRLGLIEERIGECDGGTPVVRVGSRLSGVVLAETHAEALAEAARRVVARAPAGHPLVVTIDHAVHPGAAAALRTAVEGLCTVERLIVTELSPTYGSQLGPRSAGIGVAPAPGRE